MNINRNIQPPVDFEMVKNIVPYFWVNTLLNLCNNNLFYCPCHKLVYFGADSRFIVCLDFYVALVFNYISEISRSTS